MKQFSDVLLYLRKKERESQEDLARVLGLSKSTISMYENGQRKPSYEMLEAIADHYNVDMDFLTGKSDIERRSSVAPAPGSAAVEELREKIQSLSPDLRQQFVHFLALAASDPDRAARYLAFANQELESQK